MEKVAINAVMAGCKPEYFPVVLAGVEGLCDLRLCAHGLSITLMSGAPLAIINGPVRRKIGLNCGHNALGHGFRANATIGRALRLVTMNIGGAKPHGVTKATMGHPGQYSFVVAENEEASPLVPLHVERGFKKEDSVVTLFGATGMQQLVDFGSNSAERLVTHAGPDHWRRTAELQGLSADVRHRDGAGPGARQYHRARRLVQGRRAPITCMKTSCGGPMKRELAPPAATAKWMTPDGAIRKFRSPDAIMIVVAGGTAGRFSVVIPGWVSEELEGSSPVSHLIRLE